MSSIFWVFFFFTYHFLFAVHRREVLSLPQTPQRVASRAWLIMNWVCLSPVRLHLHLLHFLHLLHLRHFSYFYACGVRLQTIVVVGVAFPHVLLGWLHIVCRSSRRSRGVADWGRGRQTEGVAAKGRHSSNNFCHANQAAIKKCF